jgi:hypothetical protein
MLTISPRKQGKFIQTGLLACWAFAGAACATEDFKLRFPLAGSLGGEIAAPLDKAGWYASTVMTSARLYKLNDNEGRARVETTTTTVTAHPVTKAPLPAPVSYTAATAIGFSQTQTQANLLLAYLSEPDYGGGRLSIALNLPYTPKLERHVSLSGATPTATGISPGANGAIQTLLNAGYQSAQDSRSSATSGTTDGLGDAEFAGAWVYRHGPTRWVAGLTLATPTGKHDKSGTTLDIGAGNFYTLRTALAVSYHAASSWTVGAKASLGFSSRNKDTEVRSGNFAALDLAAVYPTPIGVLGPHLVHVRQYQSDSVDSFGRFRSTSAGAILSIPIKSLGAGVNLSYARTIDARNAFSGASLQARLSKAF